MKNMIYKIFPVIFLSINNFLFAQYRLEKTTEFQINSLSSINIVDYDPINKHYLAFKNQSKGHVVQLIDEKGRVLHNKNLEGQGPGEFNSSMNFLGFSDREDIWVITPNKIIKYDKKLNFKESEKFVIDNPFYTYGGTTSLVFFYKDNVKDKMVFATYPSGIARFMKATSLEKHHLIELHELRTQKTYHLAPIAERPIYKHLDNSINSMYKPIFAQDKKNNRLYVTATLDNEITAIDLKSGNTLSNIKINHGDFGSFRKFPISDKSLPSYPPYTLASINSKIFYLDNGLLVLDYVREIPYGVFEKKRADEIHYHHFNDPDFHRIIIFDQKKQLSGDLEIPYGQIQIAMPNNSLLIKLINPDKEEDFIRYGIFQVVKE
ncbi:hypothetical protein [Anditalea andensis]|uniref:6-bladed beta-propeller n=1 Tax=Anditalea andensis TaxID=1048983 RepID=A0A074LNB9_9BACT|nr:hypothetical protein [Anditalea andensis]KEO75427.1 hypothetical protein EL17_00775 [Anditalea andensis]